jgi:hypothetical protein
VDVTREVKYGNILKDGTSKNDKNYKEYIYIMRLWNNYRDIWKPSKHIYINVIETGNKIAKLANPVK